jgi:GT2 family glycosyltransferase
MRITVVICTHNRIDLLRTSIGYLDRAERPQGIPVQILVIANGCEDATEAWLQEREAGRSSEALPLTWAREPKLGKSHALNLAIDRIREAGGNEGHVVAFVDDDQFADAGYLLGVARAAEEIPDVTMFCGHIFPNWDGREPSWVRDTGKYRIYPLPVPRFDLGDTPRPVTPDVGVPAGGNLFVRAGVLERVGGFSTDMGPRGHNLSGGEDSDFVLRALDKGERLYYVPYVTQYHYVDLDRLRLRYLVRKSFLRTYSAARLHLRPEGEGRGIPLYLWRKMATYGCKAVCSLSIARSRFYLIRLAAALGEAWARRLPGSR